MRTPCKDCRRRKLNCHGICEDYQAYRVKLDAIKAEKEKRRDSEPMACDRVYKNVSKWLKIPKRWK